MMAIANDDNGDDDDYDANDDDVDDCYFICYY